jgi:hypothetical protein
MARKAGAESGGRAVIDSCARTSELHKNFLTHPFVFTKFFAKKVLRERDETRGNVPEESLKIFFVTHHLDFAAGNACARLRFSKFS